MECFYCGDYIPSDNVAFFRSHFLYNSDFRAISISDKITCGPCQTELENMGIA